MIIRTAMKDNEDDEMGIKMRSWMVMETTGCRYEMMDEDGRRLR